MVLVNYKSVLLISRQGEFLPVIHTWNRNVEANAFGGMVML